MPLGTAEPHVPGIELAETMFNAYNNHGPNPWLTYDGKPVPRWHELNDDVRNKWRSAANAARYVVSGK